MIKHEAGTGPDKTRRDKRGKSTRLTDRQIGRLVWFPSLGKVLGDTSREEKEGKGRSRGRWNGQDRTIHGRVALAWSSRALKLPELSGNFIRYY